MDAWLTPDSLPDDNVCICISCPNTVDWISTVWGALDLLTNAENWEEFGALTPDEVAEIFELRWREMQAGKRCMIIGTVFNFAGDTPPNGCLIANGQQIAVADYPNLFDVIGYTYGGSGLNFNVPDLVDRFTVGSENEYDLADVGGQSRVTLTVSQLARHDHTLPTLGFTIVAAGVPQIVNTALGSVATTGKTGSSSSHENKPPWIALLPCIQAE